MVDNNYLTSILKPWSTLNQVTSIDKLHTIKKIDSFPTSFIINTEPFPRYGHWIVIIFNSKYHAIYFDSLAKSATIEKSEIKQFINKNTNSIEFNLYPLQTIFSHHCGFYCIAKIISHMLGESHLKFVNYFSNNLSTNDEIVIKLIIHNLGSIY